VCWTPAGPAVVCRPTLPSTARTLAGTMHVLNCDICYCGPPGWQSRSTAGHQGSCCTMCVALIWSSRCFFISQLRLWACNGFVTCLRGRLRLSCCARTVGDCFHDQDLRRRPGGFRMML
jgi:hypothetical protein